jgi:hypothetical protein
LAETNWIQIASSLVGGGAVGAIITLLVTTYRNRKQPVALRQEIVPVFTAKMLGKSDITAQLNLSSPNGGYGQDVPNLSIINLEVLNSGNKDYASFKFGVTLSDGDKAVHSDVETLDRHHIANITTIIGPAAPAQLIDCTLEPFNRKDIYSFKIYVVVLDKKELPGDIELSSAEPVVFKRAARIPEIALAASKVALEIGGVKLFLR